MITASIVTHKTKLDDLVRIINCLKKSSVSKFWVIDNSPDRSLEFIVKSSGGIYMYVENRGYGAGHNIAIYEAFKYGSTYHIVLNADVYWSGDVPGILAGYMEKDKSIGLCMPRVFYPDGMLQYTCRMLPTPYDVFAKRFLPKCLIKGRMNRYMLAYADHSKIINVPYLLGSFMFFRCETLKKEGVFDERFFMYPEDIDITRRIHRNWKTLYLPIVDVVHAHEAASRKSYKMLWIHIINMTRYFFKWGWFFDRERTLFNTQLLQDISSKNSTSVDVGRG